MLYDAITLDTNIFDENGLNLEGGLLAQLSQFKGGSAQLILSEIVVREVRKHLLQEAREVRESLNRLAKVATRTTLISQDLATHITSTLEDPNLPETICRTRIKDFFTATGAHVVFGHQADITELIKKYFAAEPPFEETAKKKHEFPDAIALLSIEAWAKEQNKRVLAISRDKGWIEYAKRSALIDVEPDLAAALEKFQKHAKEAHAYLAKILTGFDAGKYPEQNQKIIDSVTLSISTLDAMADGYSDIQFENEGVSLDYQDMRFIRAGSEYEFTVIAVGTKKIVAKVEIAIDVSAHAEFALSVWDSVDKEYVSMGHVERNTDETLDAAIVITIEGDVSIDPPVFDVTGAELIEAPSTIDFGYIYFDHDHHDQDDESSDEVPYEPEPPF